LPIALDLALQHSVLDALRFWLSASLFCMSSADCRLRSSASAAMYRSSPIRNLRLLDLQPWRSPTQSPSALLII